MSLARFQDIARRARRLRKQDAAVFLYIHDLAFPLTLPSGTGEAMRLRSAKRRFLSEVVGKLLRGAAACGSMRLSSGALLKLSERGL